MDDIRERIDELYRSEGRRVFASLVRLMRDFDLSEKVLHEALPRPSNRSGGTSGAARFRARGDLPRVHRGVLGHRRFRHGVVVTFTDDDHVEIAGEAWENGKPSPSHCGTMTIVRKK